MSQKLDPLDFEPSMQRIGKSEPDMRTCAVCGQTYDMRDLLHADRHTDSPHEPLAAALKQQEPRS